ETYYPVNCPKWHEDTEVDYRPFNYSTGTVTENGTATTTVVMTPSGITNSITDPLGRTRSFGTEGGFVYSTGFVSDDRIAGATQPEGNGQLVTRASRGNVTALTTVAKSGSGLSNIVSTASYPSSCSNIKTCNQPDYTIDPNGNRTDYTYDSNHGG